MNHIPGTTQRQLHRLYCEWGRDERQFQAVFPVFKADYKVVGLLGLTLGQPPVWYKDVPSAVLRGRLRFKAPHLEEPPRTLDALSEPVLANTYLCDPWHVSLQTLPAFTPAPDWPLPTDLFERTVGGQPIIDVIFEPPLHRVRGFVLRKGIWFRTRRVQVLSLPALLQALDPPPEVRRRGAKGAPPEPPEPPSEPAPVAQS